MSINRISLSFSISSLSLFLIQYHSFLHAKLLCAFLIFSPSKFLSLSALFHSFFLTFPSCLFLSTFVFLSLPLSPSSHYLSVSFLQSLSPHLPLFLKHKTRIATITFQAMKVSCIEMFKPDWDLEQLAVGQDTTCPCWGFVAWVHKWKWLLVVAGTPVGLILTQWSSKRQITGEQSDSFVRFYWKFPGRSLKYPGGLFINSTKDKKY